MVHGYWHQIEQRSTVSEGQSDEGRLNNGAHLDRPDKLNRVSNISISDLTSEFGCTARALAGSTRTKG